MFKPSVLGLQLLHNVHFSHLIFPRQFRSHLCVCVFLNFQWMSVSSPILINNSNFINCMLSNEESTTALLYRYQKLHFSQFSAGLRGASFFSWWPPPFGGLFASCYKMNRLESLKSYLRFSQNSPIAFPFYFWYLVRGWKRPPQHLCCFSRMSQGTWFHTRSPIARRALLSLDASRSVHTYFLKAFSQRPSMRSPLCFGSSFLCSRMISLELCRTRAWFPSHHGNTLMWLFWIVPGQLSTYVGADIN